jgi:hypothetical protein
MLCIGAQEPYKPAAHLRLLEQLPQHPREYAGYLDLPGPLPLIKPGTQLRIRDEAFAVGDMLGEGGFAKVSITFFLLLRLVSSYRTAANLFNNLY